MSQTTVGRLKIESTGGKQAAAQLNQVGKATEQVGRNQTRLGQASASAGRQFAAQSQGLGGLVTAYAGAAANVFAISAAFLALSRSAQFEQVIAGTNALASSIGANGEDIINTVNEITKSQLNLLETAQTVNIGLAAGFNTSQIEQLSDVSLRASKALGRSLTDAFTRVSRGAAKLEPELLDELGIFTRIDPAVRKYADSIGVSVTSLTNFERRQAFVNAVIEEGAFKFRDVDTSSKTSAESLEQLASTITNLGLQFGALLANGIAPVADFISGSLSNSLALFGLLARTIGGSAIAVLSAGINSTTAAISNFGITAANSLNKTSSRFKQATVAVQEFSAANKLSISSISQKAQAINQELILLQANIASNKVKTKSELEAAAAVLQSAITEGRAAKARTSNTQKIIRQRRELALLRVELSKVNSAIAASTAASNLFSRATTGLAKGIGFVGRALSRVLTPLFTIITVASLAQLALDALGKAFGFNVNLFESAVGFLKKVIESFSAVENSVRAFASAHQESMRSAAEAAAIYGENVQESMNIAIESFAEALNVAKGLADGSILAFLRATEAELFLFLTGADVALLGVNARIKELAKETPGAAAALAELRDRLLELGSGDLGVGLNVSTIIEAIAKSSGVATSEVSKLVQGIDKIKNLSFTVDGAGGVQATFRGINLQIAKINEDGLVEFEAGAKEITGAFISSLDAFRDFNEDFKRGALDAEKAAQGIGRIQNSITRLISEGADASARVVLINQTLANTSIELTDEARAQLILEREELKIASLTADTLSEQLKIKLNIARVDADRLASLEKESKIFDKVFGKPGEKIDRLVAQGEISSTGERAGSGEEKSLNRILYLTNLIEKGNEKNLSSLTEAERSQINIVKSAQEAVALSRKQLADAKERGASETELEEISKGINTALKKANEEQEKLTKKSSEFLANEKLARAATEALVLEREKIRATLEKELRTQDKITRKLEEQALIAKSNLAIEQSKGRQAAEKALNDSFAQRLKFAKQLAELSGQLNGSDLVAATRGELLISLQTSRDEAAERKKQIAQQLKIAKLREKNADLDRRAALVDRKDRLDIVKSQLDGLKAFNEDLDEILRNRIEDLARANKLEGFEVSTIQPNAMSNLGVTENTINVDDLATEFDKYIKRQTTALDNLNRDTNDALEQKAVNQRAALKAEIEAEELAAVQKLAIAKLEANETFRVFKGVASVVNEELSDSLNEFFDAVAQGTITMSSFVQGFKDMLFNIFEGIRKTVLEETLIKPIQKQATGLLADVFGIDALKEQSINEALVEVSGGKAMRVTFADGEGFEKFLTEGATEDQSLFERAYNGFKDTLKKFGIDIGEVFTMLSSKVTDVFSNINFGSLGGGSSGGGGLFSSIFSMFGGGGSPLSSIGVGQSFSNFAPNPLGGFGGLASGGFVDSQLKRMASGGMMRDRVPALLEPGEFVMKKQSVKSIGAGNMAMMNATGKNGGNVVVNIKNEGTPQDAQAAQPRFDGEKMVIDIVTRDLRNNGPIRKSLRGGAA